MFRNLSTYVLFLLLGTPLAALAQGTGTVAGTVTDATGETLIGANVLITGTGLGAATDIDGNYRIIGVPVGEYNVTASYSGFNPSTVEAVRVSSGLTTDVNFQLSEQSLGGEEGITVYARPIIENDAIGVPRVVSGDDIENLPVRGVAAVASLQGSVVSDDGGGDLNIRGGRGEEVAYYVDGVKVSGTALGTGPVGVNQQAILEQEMLIGTIPARYGDVQGGVISITTRTGRDEFFGSAELITSEVLDSYGYNLASLSLGGPIVPGRVGFFLSGQGVLQADANPYGVETFRLSDEAFSSLQQNPQVLRVENANGDQQYIPFPSGQLGESISQDSLEALLDIPDGYTLVDSAPINAAGTFTEEDFELSRGKDDPLDELTFNGNLNFNITDDLSFRLGGGYNTRSAEEYSFTNSLYNRDVFLNDERDSYRVYGTFRQRVSENAFYQLQGEFQDFQYVQYPNAFSSNVEDVLRYGDADDPSNDIGQRYYVFLNGRYERLFDTDGSSRPINVGGTFALPGRGASAGTNNYQKSHDQQFRFSGSATTQLGVNQLEFGGEYEQETRRFFSINPNSLARFFDDRQFDSEGNLISGGIEGNVLGLPFEVIDGDTVTVGVSDYSQIPFEAVRQITNYYGYDYLGLNEVDDEDIDAYYDTDENGARGNTNIAPYQPRYYAGYVQDKIEFQDLVINLGMRVDVFDNNTQVLRDIYAPIPIVRAGDLDDSPGSVDSDWAVYFDDAGNVVGFRDLDGNFYDAEGTEALEADITDELSGQVLEATDENGDPLPRSAAFEDYSPQVTVMPRVGVSFPVTDRALFFASYNVTSQRPTENAFAPFRAYEAISQQDSRVSNARLEPERTTQYELGFRQRLGERAAMTISGFYRTQENKISNRPASGGFPAYGTYLNADFTTTQGVELGFDLRRTNNLAMTANYTLSFAQGTGSDAGATANIVWRGDYFPQFISPADFDQRHTINASVDYRFGEDEGPMIAGSRLLENFGINLLGQFGSGQRYTPIGRSNFNVNDSFTANVQGDINSGQLPPTSRIDLRVDRSFALGFRDARLKAYLWVQNLLDTRNVLAVYRATGQANEDGFLNSPGGQAYTGGADDPAGAAFNYDAFTSGPINIGGNQSSGGGSFYGLPRRIRLGLLFDF